MRHISGDVHSYIDNIVSSNPPRQQHPSHKQYVPNVSVNHASVLCACDCVHKQTRASVCEDVRLISSVSFFGGGGNAARVEHLDQTQSFQNSPPPRMLVSPILPYWTLAPDLLRQTHTEEYFRGGWKDTRDACAFRSSPVSRTLALCPL